MAFPIYPRASVEAADMKIICHGNSHTAGEGASSTSTRWTAMMQTHYPALGRGITVVNSGIGGQSITAMIGNASTAVDAHLDNTKLNVLFGQEFGNEMAANGRDAVAAHAKWVTYCNARRAAAEARGARLYIITVGLHPTAAGASDAITNQRMAANILANQLIRANYRSYSDQLLDVGAHEPWASLFAGGDWSVSAFNASGMYFRSDGTPDDRVHLGNAGHARLGALAARALTRVRR